MERRDLYTYLDVMLDLGIRPRDVIRILKIKEETLRAFCPNPALDYPNQILRDKEEVANAVRNELVNLMTDDSLYPEGEQRKMLIRFLRIWLDQKDPVLPPPIPTSQPKSSGILYFLEAQRARIQEAAKEKPDDGWGRTLLEALLFPIHTIKKKLKS